MTIIAKLGSKQPLPHAIWAWKLFGQNPQASGPQDPLYSYFHPKLREALPIAATMGTYRRYTPGRPSLEHPNGLGFFCSHSFTDYVLRHIGPYIHRWMKARRTSAFHINGNKLWLIAIPKGTPIQTGWDSESNRSVLPTQALIPLVPLRGHHSLDSVVKWAEQHWHQAEPNLPTYTELTSNRRTSHV